jgi:hypothetical protein
MNKHTSSVVVSANFVKQALDQASLCLAAPDLLDICQQILLTIHSGADLSESFECRCDDKENGFICLGHTLENTIKKAKGE